MGNGIEDGESYYFYICFVFRYDLISAGCMRCERIGVICHNSGNKVASIYR